MKTTPKETTLERDLLSQEGKLPTPIYERFPLLIRGITKGLPSPEILFISLSLEIKKPQQDINPGELEPEVALVSPEVALVSPVVSPVVSPEVSSVSSESPIVPPTVMLPEIFTEVPTVILPTVPSELPVGAISLTPPKANNQDKSSVGWLSQAVVYGGMCLLASYFNSVP